MSGRGLRHVPASMEAFDRTSASIYKEQAILVHGAMT